MGVVVGVGGNGVDEAVETGAGVGVEGGAVSVMKTAVGEAISAEEGRLQAAIKRENNK